MLPIAFEPTDGSTVAIAATTTSARHILGGQPSQGGQRFQLRVTNDGTTVAYVRFGDSTVTAAATDMPLMPGSTSVISVTVPPTLTTGLYAAAIMATGTANISFTTGAGIS